MSAKQNFLDLITASARTLIREGGASPKEAVEKVISLLKEYAPLPASEADLIRFYLNYQVNEDFAASVRDAVFRDVQRQLGLI